MAVNDHDISVLNSLIKATIDSAEGFGRSAGDADASELKIAYRDFAAARERIVARLQDRVRQLGATPAREGLPSSQLLRRWDDLLRAITGGNDCAVVEEVERSEDHIRGQYEAALADRSLSPPTRAVIEQCYKSIAPSHDTRPKQSMPRAESWSPP